MNLPSLPAIHQSSGHWHRLAAYVDQTIGLDFHESRRNDLPGLFRPAAHAYGFTDMLACIDWLLDQPADPIRLQTLARHLANGETYFFRDDVQLRALNERVLRPLIEKRSAGMRRLRIWSVPCSNGEEAYTLAMLVSMLLDEPETWRLDIVGSDVRADAIERAGRAEYGAWSFRGMPPHILDSFFSALPGKRFRIIPRIRSMVRFSQANLVSDESVWPDGEFDVILCRHVLMYFNAAQIRRVVSRLHGRLADGGHLVVGTVETPATPWHGFGFVPHAAGVLRKLAYTGTMTFEPEQVWPRIEYRPVSRQPQTAAETEMAYPHRIRLLANAGRTQEALALCEQWLCGAAAADPQAHYLHALILREHGAASRQVQVALELALRLDERFVLANFELGLLELNQNHPARAYKYFSAAQMLLAQQRPEQLVPAGDGLTVVALADMLTMLALREHTS
ncbi:CheR family methyltransferase [Brenneria goodwinii]|uniref:CheR family methyltransferase n=1 Tax=Brenneria goodwinii TaxID=1109412 RepID=UPI0036E46E6E